MKGNFCSPGAVQVNQPLHPSLLPPLSSFCDPLPSPPLISSFFLLPPPFPYSLSFLLFIDWQQFLMYYLKCKNNFNEPRKYLISWSLYSSGEIKENITNIREKWEKKALHSEFLFSLASDASHVLLQVLLASPVSGTCGHLLLPQPSPWQPVPKVDFSGLQWTLSATLIWARPFFFSLPLLPLLLIIIVQVWVIPIPT